MNLMLIKYLNNNIISSTLVYFNWMMILIDIPIKKKEKNNEKMILIDIMLS